MIRGLAMVRHDRITLPPSGKRRRRQAREHIVGMVVDIGFGAS
jgi:hypothetical protein